MKNTGFSLKKQNDNATTKPKKKEDVVFFSQHNKALTVGRATICSDGPWGLMSPSPPFLLEAS